MKGNFDDLCIMKAVVLIAILVLAIMACLFFSVANEDIHQPKQHTTQVVMIGKHQSNDSLLNQQLAIRMDSVISVLNDINQKYPQEIDTAINKTNIWMGFWMTILTFILMICGFWQYLKVKDDRDKQRELIDKLKQQTADMMDDRVKFNTRLEAENIISITLRTIGAINDPVMLTSIDKRKASIKHYLGNVALHLEEYSGCMENAQIKNNSLEIAQQTILNLQLCLCRIQPLFSSPQTNIKILKALDDLQVKEMDLRIANKVDAGDVKNVAKLIRGLLEVL